MLSLCLFGEEKKYERQELDELVLSKKFIGKRLGDIAKNYEKEFEWLSSAQNGLRSPGRHFTLMGRNVGEIVIRGDRGEVVNASVSIFNRGDDKKILKNRYEELLDEWKSALNEHLKVEPRSRDKKGVVKTTGWVWRKNGVAYLLEGSIAEKSNRAEFIRLRLASAESSRRKSKTKARGTLVRNVKRENGDVYVANLPMVDQGAKGYCVVASVERVARYYGLQVDQHEIAQVAGTTASGGTKGNDMEKAFKKITGKIHVKTLGLMDYSYKQYSRDLKTYNRAAKKAGAEYFNENLNSATYFWHKADKNVFKQVKAKQPKYAFFKRKIEDYVNQGIPLCWTLYLGMFPEEDGVQRYGGHMRIIHGYNKKKEEILYTDSWGEGHEMKRMPAIEAWCMTTALYAMVPTN